MPAPSGNIVDQPDFGAAPGPKERNGGDPLRTTSASILSYVLIAPAIGTLTFLGLMGLPLSLWREGAAVLLIVGFGYVAGAIPAVITGGAAALLGSRPLWQRLAFPGLVAVGIVEITVPVVLRADWNGSGERLRLALGIAGFAGALAAALVLEWWRRGSREAA